MNDSLSHRGPDGSGIHIDAGVGLGHRRLSIIDIDGGHQPMYNDDRSVVVVFNGEIYNYKELRKELLRGGCKFNSQSDTEVIIRLYESKGLDCLDDLNGMFAFAIWDSRKQLLFAARDRLGEKPFYYQQKGSCLAFASELKAILSVRESQREIDVSAMDDFLAYGYVPAPKTIYKGIHKLPPAHYLLWQNGTVKTACYWTPTHTERRNSRPIEEYRDELRTLLHDSVRMRLRSDVPIGAFLSGGIDSSLIVALASPLHPEPLNTFSIGFKEGDFDESAYARIVADRYQTNHHEIQVQPLDLTEFPALVSHFDEPFADASALPTFVVCREAVKHVKVCLSGDAGDELFGGYPQYKYERFEEILDRVPESIRRPILGTMADVLPLRLNGKGWLGRMAVSDEQRYQRKLGIFGAQERQRLFREEYEHVVDHDAWLFSSYFGRQGGDVISNRLATDLKTYLPDDILVKVDRASMLNSLEVRVPLLDHRIVEFACRLPLDMKIRNGSQKFLLKELLRDLVPASVVNRGKQGFGVPLKHWFRGDYRGFLQDMLLSKGARTADYFRPEMVKSLIDAHQRGPRDLSNRLWALLWFEQWLRQCPTR